MTSNSSYWSGLLPKEETEALTFIRENPTFDGRGVIVGILDTGVDPGAIGLQITSDGKPKVIDLVDCSGSGDVMMGPLIEQTIEEDADGNKIGYVLGVGGKRLTVNLGWKNPSGTYRVGIKRASELYPNGLKSRIEEERKRIWMNKHKNLEASLQQELSNSADNNDEDLKARIALVKSYEKEWDDPGPIYDCLVYHDGERWNAIVDTTESGDISGLQPMRNYAYAREYRRFSGLDALNFAVNIFDNGDILSIVVDAGAHGSHVAGIVSAYHPDHPELNGIAPGAQIISLKIGNSRLGSMETGPGLIRALLEAVRRGCHIINMSYGEAAAQDNTGAFIQLAETIVKKYGIVFVGSAGNNGPALSTMGAPCGTSSAIIGVGAMVTQSLINAAYSSPTPEKLKETNYTWSSMGPTTDGHRGVSVLAPGGAITSVPLWTLSRNQLMNGTSMAAPNATGCISLLLSAAKASGIPKHKLNPLVIRKIIENSALRLPNVEDLGQGGGLIQVKKAWDTIVAQFIPEQQPNSWVDVSFDVKVHSSRFSRGIYLRQPIESNSANTFKIEINPIFFPEKEKEPISPDILTQFEMRIVLKSNLEWVQIPKSLLINQAGKTISVSIDPRDLPVGKIYFGTINGFDENFQEKGPLFEIPITVIRPHVVPPGTTSMNLNVSEIMYAGQRERKFVVPPVGCSYVDVIVTDKRVPPIAATAATASPTADDFDVVPANSVSTSSSSSSSCRPLSSTTSTASMFEEDCGQRMLVLHALQILPGEPYRNHEKHQYLYMEPGTSKVVSFAVFESITLEIVLASFWSTAGDSSMDVQVNFKGVRPEPAEVSLHGGQRVSNIVRLSAHLGQTEVSPTVKLDKWKQIIRPSYLGKISTLGERDVSLDGITQYQMMIEYDFEQTEAGDVTPRWPALQGVLYESQYTGQFFMLYDNNKRLVGVGDAWPSAIKTKKGKHKLFIQIRANSLAALEVLNDMPVVLERSLKSSISLMSFSNQTDAARGTSGANKTIQLQNGCSVGLFLREPSFDQLPKTANPGDVLTGKIEYLKNSKNELGAGNRPGGYKISYTIADAKPPALTSNNSSNSPKISKDSTATTATTAVAQDTLEDVNKNLNETIRDAKFKFLTDLPDASSSHFDYLAESFIKEYPSYLPVRRLILSRMTKTSRSVNMTKEKNAVSTQESDLKQKFEFLIKIITTADQIISMIDEKELALNFGVNLDKEDKKASAARKDFEVIKSTLVAALVSKANALIEISNHLDLPVSTNLENFKAEHPTLVEKDKVKELLNLTIKEIQKWDDLTNDKFWQLNFDRYKSDKKWGLFLKKINEMTNILSEAKNKDKDLPSEDELFEAQGLCFEALGEDWSHIKDNTVKWNRFLKKNTYEPF